MQTTERAAFWANTDCHVRVGNRLCTATMTSRTHSAHMSSILDPSLGGSAQVRGPQVDDDTNLRQLHICLPAIPQCFPSTSVEAPANPELHRTGQGPLEQLIQWEAQQVGLEEGFAPRHHRQHHCQHENRESEGTAVAQQAPPVLQLSSAVICS